MRADRLLSVLLLLQSRGTVTAAEVAEELEVSERTARRDLEALSMAGVPVYSRQGRGGGWQLVGGARTDLTGLTADEARALFLVAGPASEATPQVKAALRKLVQALPEPFRPSAEAASAAVVVDPNGWGHGTGGERPAPPHLADLQRAVVEGDQVDLGYVDRRREATVRRVHPLGLAAKRQVWYLVADTEAGLRTFRVDRVTSVVAVGEPARRPEGFDLAEAWRMVTTELDRKWAAVTAHGTADPDVVSTMRMVLGSRLRIGPVTPEGRVEVEIDGPAPYPLAAELAGWGAGLDVREPVEMREHLARIGAELTATYGPVEQT